MRSKSTWCLIVTALIMIAGSNGYSADPSSEVKSFFQKYVDLGNAFDASITDLYSSDAKITNTRYYPDGHTKTINIPMPTYKQMIVTSMPLAKAHNDQDSFSKVSYEDYKGSTKITALRHNKVKNYDSLLVLVVSKTPAGLKITQEISQSRP